MSEKKIVFVNNTAATSGGALTILIQFIENVAINFDENYIFYIFCTVELNQYNSDKIKIINNVKGKKWIDRIAWDLYGLKKWSEVNKIEPNLIISLQNTGIFGFNGINQIIYLHQSLPYYKNAKWNLFKKRERKLWFYKNIYKYIIEKSLKNSDIIVQTKWMKSAVSNTHAINTERIHVIPPSINSIESKNVNYIDKKCDYMLFYPAILAEYKNHMVILRALKLLKANNIKSKIKVIFTFDKFDKDALKINEYIIKHSLENEVEFVGKLSYERVLEYYKSSDAVLFPSYIETFGLPLIEAAQFGIPIIVSNLDYAHEALKGYNGARYVEYSDAQKWSNEISDLINKSNEDYKYTNKLIDNWYLMKNLIKNKAA